MVPARVGRGPPAPERPAGAEQDDADGDEPGTPEHVACEVGEAQIAVSGEHGTTECDELRDSGAADVALAAHASWYADRAEACAVEIRGPEQPGWLHFVRAERADVDAALAWSKRHDPSVGERIAVGLGWAWAVLGDGSAAAARLRTAVGRDAAPEVRARAALVAAWLEASAGDLELAHQDLAAAEAEHVRDPRLHADLSWNRAFAAIQSGRPDAALTHATEALDAYRQLELGWESGAAQLLLAYGSLMVGDAESADALARQAVDVIEGTGDSWGLLHAKGILAGVAAGQGRLDGAVRSFAEAAEAATAMGFTGQAALHLASRARILVVLEDPSAADAVHAALAAASAVGDGRLAAGLRVHAAQLARMEGDRAAAATLLRENQEWFAAHGGGDRAALTHVLLGALQDDEDTLTGLLDSELDPASRQATLDALGRLASQTGQPEKAAELWAAADSVEVPAPDVILRSDRSLAP